MSREKVNYGEFNEAMRIYINLPEKDRKISYLESLKENKELKSLPIKVGPTFNNINEDYKIEAPNDLNVTLFKRRIVQGGKNEGNEVWDSIAFTPNVKMALQTLVTREINGTGIKDFKEVVVKVDELMEQISHFKISHESTEIVESEEEDNE